MKQLISFLIVMILIVNVFSWTLFSKESAHGALRKETLEQNLKMIEQFKSAKRNVPKQDAESSVSTRTIPSSIDTERRRRISEFIHKVEDNKELVKSNLTAYTSDDFVWCLDFNGCWPKQGGEAEDYGAVIFFKVPIVINGNLVLLQYSIVKLTVLRVDLYSEGTTVDTYKLSYYLDAIQLNPVTFQYEEQKSIFWEGYYTFKKNSTLIESESIFNVEKGGLDYYSAAVGDPDSGLLCTLILGIPGVVDGVCTVGSAYEQFSSFQQCVAEMDAVNAYQATIKQCPDRQTSNTTACRQGHAVTAGGNPPQSQATHCPHVGVPSTVCIDRCRSVCDQCHPNADCALDISINGTRVYSCECAPGYGGDGISSCVKKQCTADYQCGTGEFYNYAQCDTQNQICKCKNSFTWNPSTQRCECQGKAGIRWINGAPVCLTEGRCEEQYHCSTSATNTAGQATPVIGDYSDLQCIDRGSSQFLPHKTCICNYGFQGGFFTSCSCPSPFRKVWSSVVGGNVCLAQDECTDDWQCTGGKHCNKTNGPSAGVGICQ